jgi:hypothetical protein
MVLRTWYLVLDTKTYLYMVLRTWYLVLDTKTYLYMVLRTWYLVQKKEADFSISLFFRSGFD